MSGYGEVRNIYQIGNVRVEGFQDTWPDANVDSAGKNEKFAGKSRYLLADTHHDIEQPSLTLSLLLYNDGYYTAGEYAQRLKSMVGAVVDVVAYERIETQFDKPCPCSTCDDCDCQCLLLWLTTMARIKSVDIVADTDFYTYSGKVQLEPLAHFEVMNRYLWYVTGEGESPMTAYSWDTPVNEIYPYQDCEFLDVDGCWVFAKKRPINKEIFFDPAWLSIQHDYGYEQYPDTGFFRDYSFDNGIYYINIDPLFSAPSKALYLFKFNEYTVSRNWDRQTKLRFENINGFQEPFAGIITIDWEVVNNVAVSLGYTWTGNEVLALGDIRDYFVVMDEDFNIQFKISQAVSFNGRWRGNLLPGRNQLRVTNFAGMETLYFHTFRRY